MKIRKVIIIGLFTLIIGAGIKYIDLCVSEKYETQLEGLNPTAQQIIKAEELKKKIDLNKKIMLSIIVISLVAIYPASLIKK